MTGSTKILTVSYGTFSCTLEGFDDPLGTMRELAEYFRDLAADDRYFGAEPPTPDVEMLQNIAQREVRQKVEARTSPTGISLTQVDSATDASQEQHPPATEVADPDKGPLTFDDDFLMADEPEDVLAVDPDATPAEVGPAETVAEKLRRIRAVVSRQPGETSDFLSAPKATSAKDTRDRALSETIRQIQDDLSDDESAPSIEPESEIAPEAPEADDTFEEEILEIETVEVEVEISAGLDLSDTDDSDDDLAMSQLLENVSERTEHVDEAEPKHTKPLSDENTDADVGRLLEETDNKLNEDGVVRRRQVISQMRAAVAATKADRAVTRLISVEDPEEVEKKAYRNDLSDAVGETKPLPEKTTARIPSGPPLVLVSSQRVKEDIVEDRGGEVSVDTPAAPAVPNESFARFVETNGAKGIEELLEAAAAYTVFSKGQDSFSRPEIMKRVAMVDPALSMSREDGLRSFGQLLRQGKFQKLERGQFTIDRESRFNPDKRIAGE